MVALLAGGMGEKFSSKKQKLYKWPEYEYAQLNVMVKSKMECTLDFYRIN